MASVRIKPVSSPLPLSALLSQILVAFTLELDNEFELRMMAAGFRGIGLSLAVWSNLFRFIGEEGIAVGDLTTFASGRAHHILPCLERWRFLTLTPPESEPPLRMKAHRRTGRAVREGYGSGRDIRRDWIVRLTPKGLQAKAVWPPLFDQIEQRWRTRFGESDLRDLRGPLEQVVNGFDVELPDGLPGLSIPYERDAFPPRVVRSEGHLPLPALLSKALLGLTLEFNRESDAPLSVAANVLRVVTDERVRVSDLPRLTGGSPEGARSGGSSSTTSRSKRAPGAGRFVPMRQVCSSAAPIRICWTASNRAGRAASVNRRSTICGRRSAPCSRGRSMDVHAYRRRCSLRQESAGPAIMRRPWDCSGSQRRSGSGRARWQRSPSPSSAVPAARSHTIHSGT